MVTYMETNTATAINAAAIREGDRVTGTYMGIPVSGTVSMIRWHTLNHETLMVFLDLDTPTEVLGQERDSVLLHVYADGSNADSYQGTGAGDAVLSVEVAR